MQHSGKCPQISGNVFHICEEQHLGLAFQLFKEAQDDIWRNWLRTTSVSGSPQQSTLKKAWVKFLGLFLNSGFWGWLSTESQPQNPKLGRFLWLLWFSVYLKTIYHLNLKLMIFVVILHVLKFDFQKFRILEILTFTHEERAAEDQLWDLLCMQLASCLEGGPLL